MDKIVYVFFGSLLVGFSSDVATQATVSTQTIPDWCFNPPGDDCSWYRECLQKRFPCEEGTSYALDFGEKFCLLYKHRYSRFNDIGQKWIAGVRKCLQVELVPMLGPSVQQTCRQIKTTAFDSHPGCYIYPGEGKPSVCDIGLINWWRVFLTIKGAVIQDATATFKQTADVIQACGANLLSDWVET